MGTTHQKKLGIVNIPNFILSFQKHKTQNLKTKEKISIKDRRYCFRHLKQVPKAGPKQGSSYLNKSASEAGSER